MFCIFHAPGGPVAEPGSGLPGVRISLPPAMGASSDGVRISTFRQDGWLDPADGAALVRVDHGPAQVLVTVYQAQTATADTAPRLQVLRLTHDTASQARPGPLGMAAGGTGRPLTSATAGIVAHVQRTGDVAGEFGTWVGTTGSGSWIEGFVLNPPDGLGPDDLEYQAVLGRGWLSPWIDGGKFCGSRGMALPLLGLNVRLKGDSGKTYECNYHATFVDGSKVGPVPAGEPCQADSLAALEAFQIVLRKRGSAAASAPHGPAPGSPAVAAAKPRPALGRAQPAASSGKPTSTKEAARSKPKRAASRASR